MLGLLFIFSVTRREKPSLSTASAPPAGTRVLSAHSIMSEPKRRISSFKSPTAFSIFPARRELLHTSSAKFSLLCAGENFFGFISYKLTLILFCASTYAASQPARPAPITLTVILHILYFSVSFLVFFLLSFSSRHLGQYLPLNLPVR